MEEWMTGRVEGWNTGGDGVLPANHPSFHSSNLPMFLPFLFQPASGGRECCLRQAVTRVFEVQGHFGA
jgi:hypothetical protein